MDKLFTEINVEILKASSTVDAIAHRKGFDRKQFSAMDMTMARHKLAMLSAAKKLIEASLEFDK